jgi:hypothetical protein
MGGSTRCKLSRWTRGIDVNRSLRIATLAVGVIDHRKRKPDFDGWAN